jgi:hypothetical protein
VSDRTDAPARSRLAFWAGILAALLAVAAAGEVYLRFFPPPDLRPYLGDCSPEAGSLAADPTFGVDYRSWDDFAGDNAARLAAYLPLAGDGRPTWALFGSSFIQAPGMLGDTARDALPGVRIFYLGRNETVPVRFAQARQLLAHGLRPERLVVALMPGDVAPLARHPLDTWHVTPRGAVTFRLPAPPGPLAALADASALASTAWIRAARPAGLDIHLRRLRDHVPLCLVADLDRLLGGLACAARDHGVPVTVLLIPTFEQVTRGQRPVFQDAVLPLALRHGLDVCDVRADFLAETEKPGLFLPDKHFSPRGNRVLLAALLRHFGEGPP